MVTEREKTTPEQDFSRFCEALKLRIVRRFAGKHAGLRLSDVKVQAGSSIVRIVMTLGGHPYVATCMLDDGQTPLDLLIPYTPEQLADMVAMRTGPFVLESALPNFDIRAAIVADSLMPHDGPPILP